MTELQTKHSPRAASSIVRAMLALASVGIVGGCHWFGGGNDDEAETLTTRPSTTQMTWRSDQPLPQALQPQNRPLEQKTLPIMYLIETPSTLRVTYTETGEDILTFPARAMQVVRVEERGILVDGKIILPVTLKQGVYALSKVPDAEAGTLKATQTIIRPVIPAAATKQPGNPKPAAAPPKPSPPTPPTATPPPPTQ